MAKVVIKRLQSSAVHKLY